MSGKVFEGSKEQSFYGEKYFLGAEGSNYGRRDAEGKLMFAPYTEEYYLPRDQALAAHLVQRFRPRSALVLGCARGYLVKSLRDLGVEAFGVDLSEWAIKNCHRDAKDFVYVGDVCDLSRWSSKQFDLVVALDVFEHVRVPDLYAAISEAARVGRNVVLDVPVGEDDSKPDRSDGSDKSHVSVYSAQWWKNQFGKHGFVASAANSYGYPDGTSGATIFFRPKPPDQKGTVAVNVAPNGKAFKVLWLSNAHFSPSGYGVQTSGYLYGGTGSKGLTEYYNVRELANYGLMGRAIGMNNLLVYPTMPAGDPMASDAAKLVIGTWNPDVFITLYDVWMGAFTREVNGGLQPLHPKWIPQVPVDHDPVPDATLEQLAVAYKVVAMSRFGESQLRNHGVEATYIPHGVDTAIYKPVSAADKKKNREWAEKNTAPINLKLPVKLSHDDFVIGVNAANTDPMRKNWQGHFSALQIFLEQNPDAKKDTKMLVHTWRRGGRNLEHLAQTLHVEPYVKAMLNYHVYAGLSAAELAEWYSTLDVFANATQAEGFGVPIIEACASGIPPIATDFTSMTELTRGHGWLVPCFAGEVECPSCRHKFSYHGGARYMSALNSLWALPDKWKLAEAYADAYNSPKKAKRLGRKARAFSLGYDWAKVVPRWLALLEEVRAEVGSFGVSESKDALFAQKAKEVLEA